jgi:hypothetical protein
MKGAHAVVSGAAKQEIRGISIRDQDSGSGWGSYAPVGMTSSLLTFWLSTDS